MRGITFPSLIALLLVGFPARADLTAQIAALIREEVEAHGFQGNVLVQGPQGEIFARSYGQADIEFSVPNTRTTKFRIGSISKQFTATAVLTLLASGKIHDLHDPIGDYLPVPASWRPVTIHELLTHTAGLSHDPPQLKREYGIYHSLNQLFDSIVTAPFLEGHSPGGPYAYSNSGYTALAYLVEKLSGMEFSQYLKKAVFEPAGLQDTGDDHDSFIVPNRARGYWIVEGKLSNASGLDLSNIEGAGSVYSTVDDLQKWDQALRENRILPSALQSMMFQPYAAIGIGPQHYGYGWVIDQWHGHRLIWHNGEVNGYSADFARFVDDKVEIITLSNRYGISASLARIRYQVAALLFSKNPSLQATKINRHCHAIASALPAQKPTQDLGQNCGL